MPPQALHSPPHPHPPEPHPAPPHHPDLRPPTPPHEPSPHPPTKPHLPPSNAPPTGWTDDEVHMSRQSEWAGNPDDTKDMMDKDFGLRDAQPIWTRLPASGDIFFIFHAIPSTGKASYYVWNGIEGSVCLIESMGIEEIREAINKFGEGKGYLMGLKLVPVTPE